MPDSHQNKESNLKKKVLWFVRVSLIFLSAFVAMALFEVQNYQHTSGRVANDFTKISNVNTSINDSNLDKYQGRTLVLYNSNCKACKEIVPKYYATNQLVNHLTFRKAPIYLDINQYDNRDIFNQLGIPSTPKQAKITNVTYNSSQQITNIEQSQSDVSPSRMAEMLVFVNIFWAAFISLVYVLMLEGLRYLSHQKSKSSYDRSNN